jgi:DNA-binding transcriptional ArsR family regulator
MSLYGDMSSALRHLDEPSPADLVWRALADATRRAILDELARRPHTTGELAERFQPLCRTNVMKHLDMLVDANLVVVRREGRTRWNYLNPVPIQRVCDRWVSRHVRHMASALTRLKDHVETSRKEKTW